MSTITTAVGERRVGVGQLAVGRGDDVLVAPGLGSCVAVVLHDAAAGVGGLAHVLLPSDAPAANAAGPARVATSAVPALVQALTAAGADPGRLVARLAGGASMFTALAPAGALRIGERNVIAVRQALRAQRIPIRAEDVGGEHGRSVRVEAGSGRVEVRTVAHGTREL